MAAGVVPTELLYAELVEMLRWYKSVRGKVGLQAGPPIATEGLFFKPTTSTADGSGNYTGVPTLWSAADAAWQEYSSAKGRPLNGEALTSGTRYPARPAGQTAAGDELYMCSAPASGSITVEAADGTPTYSSITKIRYSETANPVESCGVLLVTNPLAGQVLIGVDVFRASATVPGVVTTSAQTFAGQKTFNDSVHLSSMTISGGIVFGSAANNTISWNGGTGAPSSASATGATGMLAIDSGNLYVCIATDTWKRVAIATW